MVLLESFFIFKKITGKQGLALGVHREDISYKFSAEDNPENGLMLFQEISHYNSTLTRHFSTLFRKNTTYLSPLSQNELVEVIGINIVQSDTTSEIVKAKFFSTMTGEVTLFNNEVRSICFYFVNKNRDIREIFLEFL